MQLILWDIDHTLIDMRGIGRELSAEAFELTTGQPMREQAQIDGITEAVIFRETAKLHGIAATRADFEQFAQHLAARHLARGADIRERGHTLSGAAAALDAFAGVEDLVQTVVTGNVREVAEIKLAMFGLDRHIDWPNGAYGDDADERPDLVRICLARASERYGTAISPTDAVLIGDTPADVAAALATGVPAIAVASGKSSAEHLRRAGAAYVLDDLSDTARLVARVETVVDRG